jgi:hypothetical protein
MSAAHGQESGLVDSSVATFSSQSSRRSASASAAVTEMRSRTILFRMREWLLRSEAMREARAAADVPPARARARAQAQLVAEVADRVAAPVDALPSGSCAAVQVALCRDATYWALVAMQSDDDVVPAADLPTLWARAPAERLERAAGGAEAAEVVRRTLANGAPAYSLDTAEATAALARKFTSTLVAELDAPLKRIDRLWMQRWLRVGLVAVLLLSTGYAARVMALGPNLLAGKPFRTSSAAAVCTPITNCPSMLFHTEHENNPWIEFDLGALRPMKRVEVTNRTDCCPDRAVPLLVEISTDHTTWTQVARRDLEFLVWTESFPKTIGRYVRLRVPRATPFHLKEIVIR